jgi:hypothetical protein
LLLLLASSCLYSTFFLGLCEIVNLQARHVCRNDVFGAESWELHLLGTVRLGYQSEALLFFEGGLETAAANDSQED